VVQRGQRKPLLSNPGADRFDHDAIGAFLTSLVVAREWERGTMEALFVTPVRPDEILLGKTIPYFALGMIGLALCLLAAKFLFYVPFRGSLTVLIGVSMLYLLVALAIGLLISSAFKSQFVASQIAQAGDISPRGDALGLPV
jgi:ABC-2 type transport system permease protein